MITAQVLRDWLNHCDQDLHAAQDLLTDLDREIGDADHGLNMARGFGKVSEKLASAGELGLADILKTTGMTLLSSVGGASGPLYGTFFIKAAQAVGDKSSLALGDLAALFQAGTQGIISRGRAEAGDKTMCDVWLPVSDYLSGLPAEGDLTEALKQAQQRAEAAAEATIPLLAKKGRASYLNERSIGHKDPGAASTAIIIAALAKAVQA